MIHADYAKIKIIVEDCHAKYQNKGIIKDLNEKSNFGLSQGLKYTHFKKKDVVPVVEVIEDENEKEQGVGTLKYQSKADRIEERDA